MRRWLIGVFVFGVAGPAVAIDGVVEINQTCAVQTGCFPGDTAGFPVTVSQPGSYRLTSNLDLGSTSGISAINVTVSSVSIDLGGFLIRGPASCYNGCTVTNSAPGIQALVERLSVRNGMIRGFSYAIRAEDESTFEEIIATSNSSGGFYADRHAKFVHNVVANNNGNGIDADRGSVLTENVVLNSGGGGAGIRLRASGSSVVGNLSTSNDNMGIRCDSCTAARNLVYINDGNGISTGSGALVEGNLAYGNDSIFPNVQLGLGATAGFTNNVAVAPGGGQVVTGGVFMAPNFCQGQATEAACRN